MTSLTPASSVFWDMGDFPIPPERSVDSLLSLHANIESALMKEGCFGRLVIRAYAEMENCALETVYHFLGCKIWLFPEDKCERTQNMMIGILLWALDWPASVNEPKYLIVISKKMPEKDTDFANVLEALTNRYYEVFLVVSDDCLPEEVPLPTTASLVWRWTSLFDGGKPMEFEDDDDDCEDEGSSQADKDIDSSSYSTIGVFWDVEDFPFPNGYNVDSFRENIKSALCFGREMPIWAYSDKETPLQDDLVDDPRVTLSSQGDKDARHDRMVFDILLWAMDNRPSSDLTQDPSTVIIILKDLSLKPRFIRVIECLHCTEYNVVLVQPDDFVSEEEVQLPDVNAIWLWKSLLAGEKPLFNIGRWFN